MDGEYTLKKNGNHLFMVMKVGGGGGEGEYFQSLRVLFRRGQQKRK